MKFKEEKGLKAKWCGHPRACAHAGNRKKWVTHEHFEANFVHLLASNYKRLLGGGGGFNEKLLSLFKNYRTNVFSGSPNPTPLLSLI